MIVIMILGDIARVAHRHGSGAVIDTDALHAELEPVETSRCDSCALCLTGSPEDLERTGRRCALSGTTPEIASKSPLTRFCRF